MNKAVSIALSYKKFGNEIAEVVHTMTQESDTSSDAPAIVTLSFIILGAGLVLGVWVIIEAAQGTNFLRDVVYAIGLAIIQAGNLISWMLNLSCWGKHYRPRWLGVMLIAQPLFAVIGFSGIAYVISR